MTKYIWIIAALALLSCTPAETPDDIFDDLPTPPEITEESGDIVGKAVYAHEEKYASPFNVFVDDAQKARVFDVKPDTADLDFESDKLRFTVVVDGHAESGYTHAVLDPVLYYDYSVGQNGAWKAIPLTGDAVGTPFTTNGFSARWLRHSGTATVDISANSVPDGAFYFAAFSCWRKTKNDPWLCGPQTTIDTANHWMLESSFIRHVGFPPEPPLITSLTKATVTLVPTNLIVKPGANVDVSARLEARVRTVVPEGVQVTVYDVPGSVINTLNLVKIAPEPVVEGSAFVQKYTASVNAPQQTGRYALKLKPTPDTASVDGAFRVDAASVFANVLIENSIGVFNPVANSIFGRFYTTNGINGDEYFISYLSAPSDSVTTASVAVYPDASALTTFDAKHSSDDGWGTIRLTVNAVEQFAFIRESNGEIKIEWKHQAHVMSIRFTPSQTTEPLDVVKAYLGKYPSALTLPPCGELIQTDIGTQKHYVSYCGLNIERQGMDLEEDVPVIANNPVLAVYLALYDEYGTSRSTIAFVIDYSTTTGVVDALAKSQFGLEGTNAKLSVDGQDYDVYFVQGGPESGYAWVSGKRMVYVWNNKNSVPPEVIAKEYMRKYPGVALPVPLDLARYPQWFVTNGAFTDSVIVAEGSVDALAAVDIGANMHYDNNGVPTRVTIPVMSTKTPDEVTAEVAQNLKHFIMIGHITDRDRGLHTNKHITMPASINDMLKPGESTLKLTQNGDKVTVTVLGGSEADVRLAAQVIADYKAGQFQNQNLRAQQWTGREVCIKGTTLTDAQITSGPCTTPAAQQCTDTDGGKNYFTKGSATGLQPENLQLGTSVDVCRDANTLDEAYCGFSTTRNLPVRQVEVYTCPNGCLDGACIPQSGTAPDLTITSIQTNPQMVTPSTTPNFQVAYSIQNTGTATFDGTATIQIFKDAETTPAITETATMSGADSLTAGSVVTFVPQQALNFATTGAHTIKVKIASSTPPESTANNERTVTVNVQTSALPSACTAAQQGQYRLSNCPAGSTGQNCGTVEYCTCTGSSCTWGPVTTP